MRSTPSRGVGIRRMARPRRNARAIRLSRGSMYYLPKLVSPGDLVLMRRLDALHLGHPFMGASMLRDQLNREGVRVGRKHVSTLMKRISIKALYCKPGTSKKHPGHEIYPYLLGSSPSTGPTKSGRWTPPTSRWPLRWRPVMPWTYSPRRSSTTATPRSSTPRRPVYRTGVRAGRQG